MTQVEARNAVERILDKLSNAVYLIDAPEDALIQDIINDVKAFKKQLYTSKPAAPNCRPATQDELTALCAASNVVAFRPAA